MDSFVKDLKDGKPGAFDELVLKYKNKIYALSLSILRNPSDAEDATQETFVKIFRNIGSFEGKSALSTWIYMITRNVSLDIVRKQARYAAEEIPETLEDIHTPSPEEALLLLSKREAVRSALSKLPETYRTVLTLREYMNLSYDEISSVMNTSQGTVKSRISRARQMLLKILSENSELI